MITRIAVKEIDGIVASLEAKCASYNSVEAKHDPVAVERAINAMRKVPARKDFNATIRALNAAGDGIAVVDTKELYSPSKHQSFVVIQEQEYGLMLKPAAKVEKPAELIELIQNLKGVARLSNIAAVQSVDLAMVEVHRINKYLG